jgi:tRNA C32,U32 (ribose-2'-O)-methylase TrmJ
MWCALADKSVRPTHALAKDAELDRLRVVLVATRNPLNLGAAARAMSNFGFRHLSVVNSFEPSFREARSAVGASEILANAEQFNSVAEAVADCGGLAQCVCHRAESGACLGRIYRGHSADHE